ncbi:hypothetical protein WR25_12169 [Diploscapter pachys]|uniref:SH2 domain-containing protein n=1 Tax=Diploscapter pachys TaxID=2018661 RepID=A0A2A2KW77_9BILA|nr:hypothetical protein WR25_12169 [Diploscapter pachys]
MHLLRKMEAGNFIVRSSSRPHCMAISVKLPEGCDMETDHYIVEKVGNGGARGITSSIEIALGHIGLQNDQISAVDSSDGARFVGPSLTLYELYQIRRPNLILILYVFMSNLFLSLYLFIRPREDDRQKAFAT